MTIKFYFFSNKIKLNLEDFAKMTMPDPLKGLAEQEPDLTGDENEFEPNKDFLKGIFNSYIRFLKITRQFRARR